MAPVPVLDLQAASEERQHDAGERGVAVGGEIGVFVRGPYEHAQAFDHRVTLGTEVTRVGTLDRACKQFVDVHVHPPATLGTLRRVWHRGSLDVRPIVATHRGRRLDGEARR